MIETANRVLVALQAALFARAVYDENHPSVVGSIRRAEQALTEIFEGREHFTAMMVDDRIVCDGAPLPSSAGLCAGLFHRLGALGVEWVRFHRGADASALRALLDRIDRAERSPDAWSTPIIHVGFIKGVTGRADPSAGPSSTPIETVDSPSAVERIWKGIGTEGKLDHEALSAVVADICAAAAPAPGMFIRLAALKGHDEYTFVHTVNVSILSAALARAAGLGPQDVHDVTVAALLHDIGKTKIPGDVLNRVGEVPEAERALLRRHPVEGAVILLNTPDVPPLAAVVAFEHHVRPDGTGYPAVPPGWRTLLPTRIVQVADVFDAMRTIRPYRRAMSLSEAVAALRQSAGVSLDHDLVEVFLARVANATERDTAPGPIRTAA